METFICSQCSYQTSWPFQINRHIQRNHNNVNATELFHAEIEPKEYPCFYCEFKSKYKLNLHGHYKKRHDVENENSRNRQSYEQLDRYQCDHCNHNAHSALSFVQHSCELVPKPAPKPIDFDAIGSKVKNGFQCAHCPSLTKTKSNLKQHYTLKHAADDEIEWFNCTECSHRTRYKASLKVHMLTHTSVDEIDWINCTQCSYRANRQNRLTAHMQVHADEQLSCCQCSYRTNRKINLQRHVLRVHEAPEVVQWFDCDKCSYRARERRLLNRHDVIRHARPDQIAWLHCDKCPMKFKHKSLIYKHKRKHHVLGFGSNATVNRQKIVKRTKPIPKNASVESESRRETAQSSSKSLVQSIRLEFCKLFKKKIL